MVSFVSPLFWQIHYLVTNLSKKNFKSNVAELNQVRRVKRVKIRIFVNLLSSWPIVMEKMLESFYFHV